MGLPSIERKRASISFFALDAVEVEVADFVLEVVVEVSDKILLLARFSFVNGAEEEVVVAVEVTEGGATMGIAFDSLLKVLRGGDGIGTATGERKDEVFPLLC